MPKHQQTLAIAAFVVVIAAFSYLAIRHNNAVGNQSTGTIVPDEQYVSTTHGFSFSYPPGYSLNEYTPRYVEIRDSQTHMALADVTVEKAGADTRFKSFDEFVHHKASLTCDADGPAGSSRCPSVSRSNAFTANTGVTGEVFYLDYVLSSQGATTTREAGPFYAFDISSNIAGSRYTALLIRPSHAAEESAVYDGAVALARAIADSLKLSAFAQ